MILTINMAEWKEIVRELNIKTAKIKRKGREEQAQLQSVEVIDME